ncbi:hypothetical protein P4562_11865 [Lysinibacillus xylanilyticus]|uniref:hypothetical protein n=1 Tax=Lysinibacillus xylanilyticus TaxID=582475 RepID=UPI002E1B6A13|nr:hypothetical protein [Lysinibacillus xylanilyticus]
MKNLELSQEDLHNIDINFEGRDGLITGNVGDMVTKIKGNIISFLVGTVNNETYQEDEYKIKIKFKDKQEDAAKEAQFRYELISANESNLIIFDKKSGEYWQKFIDLNAGPTDWEKQTSPIFKSSK